MVAFLYMPIDIVMVAEESLSGRNTRVMREMK